MSVLKLRPINLKTCKPFKAGEHDLTYFSRKTISCLSVEIELHEVTSIFKSFYLEKLIKRNTRT